MKTLLIGLLLVGAFRIAAAQEKGITSPITGPGQVYFCHNSSFSDGDTRCAPHTLFPADNVRMTPHT